MFDWAIGGLGSLFGFAGDAIGSAIGWAWDKVTDGIYTWLANGLALLIEWVWSVLDSGTTPRITQDWFRNGLAVQVGAIALAVTVAMMLASGIQAALVGRPEQIVDAVRHGVWSIVASALTVTTIDVLLGVVDEASAAVWESGRADLVNMIEGMIVVATTIGPLGKTFIGPLVLLIGFLGLIGLVVSLMMRSALIYMAAALAPLVWSVDVLPSFRGSARKLIHLTVALVVSKLAIVVTLVLAVKLIANPSGDPDSGSIINDGAAAVGQLMTGFICFVVAAATPFVLYKLMPTVEGAMVSSGIAGGWARSAVAVAHTAIMVKSLGASKAASAATRPVAGQNGADGGTPRGGIAGLTGANPATDTAGQQPDSNNTTSTSSASGSGGDGSGGSKPRSGAGTGETPTNTATPPPRNRRRERGRDDAGDEQPTRGPSG